MTTGDSKLNEPKRRWPQPTPAWVLVGLLGVEGVLLLSAVFFFSYAIEQGWIGPHERVIIGALTGLAMLAGGEWALGIEVVDPRFPSFAFQALDNTADNSSSAAVAIGGFPPSSHMPRSARFWSN